MDALFVVVFTVCVFFSSMFGKPEDNRIVNLGDKLKLEQSIEGYNQTTLDDVALNKSVGNHGRYKNIGYDYEFLHREPRIITDKERKKGLRWYKTDNYNFIYMESEKTNQFVKYLKGKTDGGQSS